MDTVTLAAGEVGKYKFTIETVDANDGERQSRRAEVLTTWLLNQWQQEQSEQRHVPDYSLN